jgi:hypothetical protein
VVVASIRPRAEPVILRGREEVNVWLSAATKEATALQRPLADHVRVVVT